MHDFELCLSTNILFGKNHLNKLSDEIKKYGDRVLICYGGGSIKKSGLYDRIVEKLDENEIFHIDLSGIEPNPRVESVREGVKLIRENNLDFILAIGGGSTIDCAKTIAASVDYEGDPWDIVIKKHIPKSAVPLAAIITLSATGSEMNTSAVISNMETKEKLGWASELVRPKFSILDPSNTVTLPKSQTAAGVADIMSHTFENYFSLDDGAYLQDRLAEGILKTCIHYGPIAIEKPDCYEARANIMWASSWAINGLIGKGKVTEWSVHCMEHELSAYYDITHGVGLAILTPNWLKYVLNENTAEKIAEYGRNVFGLTGEDSYELANQAIEKTREFFNSLGLPGTLTEVGIDEEFLEEMAENAVKRRNDRINGFQTLYKDDIVKIYKDSL